MKPQEIWVYDFYWAIFARQKRCKAEDIEALFTCGERMTIPQIIHKWQGSMVCALPQDDGLWCALTDVILGHLMSMAMRRCRRLRCSVSLASKFPKLYTSEWWFE